MTYVTLTKFLEPVGVRGHCWRPMLALRICPTFPLSLTRLTSLIEQASHQASPIINDQVTSLHHQSTFSQFLLYHHEVSCVSVSVSLLVDSMIISCWCCVYLFCSHTIPCQPSGLKWGRLANFSQRRPNVWTTVCTPTEAFYDRCPP